MHIRLIAGGLIVLLGACQPKSIPSKNTIPAPETSVLAAPTEVVPTLGQLGTTEIPLDHAQVFFQERELNDSTRRDSLFAAFIREYRYFLEAKEQGFAQQVKEEVDAYRDYLANDFWEDTLSLQKLKNITFERYQSEVQLSHILVALPAFPMPQDTVDAFRKALAIRQRLDQNELPFSEAARLYSQDDKTKLSNGYLGWFGALQLVYSMEEAAFSNPVNSIQGPIRTHAGYHLIWIQNKRPYSGQVRVRHVLRTNPAESSKLLLDSLKTAIEQKILTFDEAVQQYSEDFRNKNKGGELAPFGVGDRMDPVFEDKAFSLKMVGEISEPIQTKSGWHLIQLLERTRFERTEALEYLVEDKLKTDSRGEVLENKRQERVKKELQWAVRASVRDSVLQQASGALLYKNWQNNWPSSLLKKTLFQSKSRSVLVQEFATYLVENQPQWKVPQGIEAKVWLQHQVQLFEGQVLRKVYTDFLREQPTFERLVQQHTRDLMSKLLLNDVVWEKSVADTVGQRQIFERNKEKYWQLGRMEGVVLVADEVQYLEMAQELLAEEKPYALRRGIAPLFFQKNEIELSEESEKRLKGLLGILNNQPAYLVEIGGHADIQEEDSVSAGRMQRVSMYLQSLGLDYTRIQEIDFGKTRPIERFDWQKNQRVSIQFLSYSREELAKIIQSKYGPVIAIKEGIFSAGEPWVAERVRNQLGTYRFQWEGKWYEVIVEKVLPPRPKTIREARGDVIKAYQDYLLQEFDRKLAEKYPLTLDSSVVKALLTPTHP